MKFGIRAGHTAAPPTLLLLLRLLPCGAAGAAAGAAPAPQLAQLPAAAEPPSPHALSQQQLFSQAPTFFFFFFLSEAGGGRQSLPFPLRPSPLYHFTSCRGAGPPSPAPSRPVPSVPREEGGKKRWREGWRGRPGCRHKLPLSVAVPARLLRGSHGRQRPLGCTPLSPIATALPPPAQPRAAECRGGSPPAAPSAFFLFFLSVGGRWVPARCSVLSRTVPCAGWGGEGWGARQG